MRAYPGTLIAIAVLVSGPMATAQDGPPTISVIEAYRNIQACAEADKEPQECDEVTSMAGGPFSDGVQAGISGGSFTATGMDNCFCLSLVGGGIAGFDPDGLPFVFNQVLHCESPPEDADFFSPVSHKRTQR